MRTPEISISLRSTGRKTLKPKTAILTALIAAAGIAVLFLFNPSSVDFYPPCIFHSLTGLNCPGCGTARALHQLLHGNIAAAARCNVLTLALLPLLLFAGARSLAVHISKTPYKPFFKSAFWPWLIVIAIILFGILRNIPIYPFNLLAPH